MTRDEGAAEHIKNILQCFAHPAFGKFDFTPAEAASIVARLQRVLVQIQDLEGLAIGRREHELGLMQARADFVTEQPVDYERPGQVDPVLRGQEISEDGE